MRLHAARRLARGLLIGASLTGMVVMPVGTAAETTTSQETTRSLRRALERLPYYGVFDHLTFAVDRGVVTLTRLHLNGSLRYAAEMAAKRTSGVDEVANRLEVLPASQEDDRIRWVHVLPHLHRCVPLEVRVRWRYRLRVERSTRRDAGASCISHSASTRFTSSFATASTTLYGVVDSEADRQIAEVRAREVFGVFCSRERDCRGREGREEVSEAERC